MTISSLIFSQQFFFCMCLYVHVCVCASQRSHGCLQLFFIFTLLSETGSFTEPGSHHLFRDRMSVSSRGQSVNSTPDNLLLSYRFPPPPLAFTHSGFLTCVASTLPTEAFSKPLQQPLKTKQNKQTRVGNADHC